MNKNPGTDNSHLTVQFRTLYSSIRSALAYAETLQPLIEELADGRYGNGYHIRKTETRLRLMEETQDTLADSINDLVGDILHVRKATLEDPDSKKPINEHAGAGHGPESAVGRSCQIFYPGTDELIYPPDETETDNDKAQ